VPLHGQRSQKATGGSLGRFFIALKKKAYEPKIRDFSRLSRHKLEQGLHDISSGSDVGDNKLSDLSNVSNIGKPNELFPSMLYKL
jgi:hypothetical protein